jgi:microsomal dipeptidase-like Zn-dependent dipeptidase
MTSSPLLGASDPPTLARVDTPGRAVSGLAREVLRFARPVSRLVVFLVALLVAREARADFGVDLHAHLFMKPGLGWLFHGSFEERQADHWSDRLSSKVDAAALEASGLRVVVVALFAHPVFVADMRASIRAQIAEAERFVAAHPGWVITKSPREARIHLEAGRRILVLSLEGASGVIESEEDLVELVDEAGIRIVTALHLVDDRYGGAATMTGFQLLANPLGLVDRLLDPSDREPPGSHRGLTPLGRRLAVELLRRGVWIDLTHASDAALDELVPLVEAAGQPLLFTHTPLRRFRAAERSLSDAMLARVAASGGLVGLLPSEDAFEDVAARCPVGCEPERCDESLHAFSRVWREAAAVVEPARVMLGTDVNGGMRHLAGACGVEGELGEPSGYHHLGQTSALAVAMRQLGAPVVPAADMVEAFVSAWERVVPASLSDRGLPPLPSAEASRGPSLALSLGLGVGAIQGSGVAHARLDARIRKDFAGNHSDPEIYFAPLAASADKAIASDAVPLASLVVAPLGIRAAWHDDVVWAEISRLWLARATPVDQERRLRWSAIGGGFRAMPGIAKDPGRHQLFVGLDLDLLGYEHVARTDGAEVEGVFLLDAGLTLGTRLASGDLSLALFGTARADLTALVSLPGRFPHQSDASALGTLELGGLGLVSFVEGGWIGAREVGFEDLFRSAWLFRSGLSLRR